MTEKAEEWLPIETAPKDGTRVLLWGRYWSDSQGWFTEPLYGQWTERFNGNEERWIAWGPACQFAVRPTKWMPLPAPPKDLT